MHLAETGRLYEAAFAQAIARGRERGLTGSGPFEPSWVGAWFARELEPPPKRRLPAPPRFRPRQGDAPAHAIRQDYHGAVDAVRDVLRSAEGLDLGRMRMRSPVTPLLRFNVEAGFRIHAAHERRHLWQARHVRGAEAFPA